MSRLPLHSSSVRCHASSSFLKMAAASTRSLRWFNDGRMSCLESVYVVHVCPTASRKPNGSSVSAVSVNFVIMRVAVY